MLKPPPCCDSPSKQIQHPRWGLLGMGVGALCPPFQTLPTRPRGSGTFLSLNLIPRLPCPHFPEPPGHPSPPLGFATQLPSSFPPQGLRTVPPASSRLPRPTVALFQKWVPWKFLNKSPTWGILCLLSNSTRCLIPFLLKNKLHNHPYYCC